MTNKKPSNGRKIEAKGSYTEGSVRTENGDFIGGNKIIGWSPNDAIKFMEAISKIVTPKYLDPEQFTQVSQKFKIYNETLSEWKGLHDGLDEILGQFSPFHVQIQNLRKKPRTAVPNDLKNHWFDVSIKIDELLKFSRNIKIINDEPFQEVNGKGPSWAIDFYNFKKEMNSVLETAILFGNPIYGNPDWWDRLVELTQNIYSEIISYLHMADKELRITAAALYELSERVFQR